MSAEKVRVETRKSEMDVNETGKLTATFCDRGQSETAEDRFSLFQC